MSGLNKATLIGRLGKDPEVRYLDGGPAVANFSIATTEYYKDKEGKRQEMTEWHNIVLWRGLAETAEKFLKKGSQVFIEGRITTRSWDDKEGNKRYTTEIVGSNMIMLDRPQGQTEQGSPQRSETQRQPEAVQAEQLNEPGTDDLPF